MQLSIYTLEIGQCDFLLENYLMERGDKVSVKETSVEDA